MDVTVVVGTYGASSWSDLAAERAIPSVEAQGVRVVSIHGESLHQARNAGIDLVETEFTCVVDADDELEPGFFDHMEAGTADVRAPSVRYVRNDRHALPRVPNVAGHSHPCTVECLDEGNWLVIGSVARTDLLRKVGGFHDYPIYEDWDLWVRCWKAGATIEAIPNAVYRAHVRPDSRNRGPGLADRLEGHRVIARANGLPVPA